MPIWRTRLGVALVAGFAVATGCLAPPEHDPNATLLWGSVRLVPKEGSVSAGDGYADRRLRDVVLFDYSEPRFLVVYCESHRPRTAEATRLSIVGGPDGPVRLEPPYAGATLAGGVSIHNETAQRRVVSVPEANWIQALEPGASARVTTPHNGEFTVFLVGGPDQSATVQVSPGVFTTATSSGRYELHDPGSGEHSLRAWHPRLPVSMPYPVHADRGEVARVDLDIGVDLSKGERQ